MKPPFDTSAILIGGASVIALAAFGLTLCLAILWIVGATVEHFTP